MDPAAGGASRRGAKHRGPGPEPDTQHRFCRHRRSEQNRPFRRCRRAAAVVGVVRGAMPRADAQQAVDETVRYLETKHDFKPPPAQDPTCFDFFWSPAQVRSRAHPNVLQTQRFAMGLWDNHEDDRMAIRFPIAYADRIRIHGAGVGPALDEGEKKAQADGEKSVLESAQEARKAAVELLGDFSSSTIIAQVDNGSLERWEPDGYGREGTYEAVFRGEWERYDPWDPTFRVTATPDLYNGYGACTIFRMFQGILAPEHHRAEMVRLLPSPKLATAYFLLRPFFSPKTKAPEAREGPRSGERSWTRATGRSTRTRPPSSTAPSRPRPEADGAMASPPAPATYPHHPTDPPRGRLYPLASRPGLPLHLERRVRRQPRIHAATRLDASRQRVGVCARRAAHADKRALSRTPKEDLPEGASGPDFDATGSGLGSEATHTGRPGEKEIEERWAEKAGLRAMGLMPFDVAASPRTGSAAVEDLKKDGDDVEMADAASAGDPKPTPCAARRKPKSPALRTSSCFPDRYDFYMGGRSPARRRKDPRQG